MEVSQISEGRTNFERSDFRKFSEKYGELFRVDLKVLSGGFPEFFLDIVQNVDKSTSGLPGPDYFHLIPFQRSSSLIRFESSSES